MNDFASLFEVSIIIPTYNRLHQLKKVLEGLEQQEYGLDRVEVIVVSDGSTDGTGEFLRTYAGPLHLVGLEQPNRGAAAARNFGLSKARGEILLFTDDDVVPTPQLLAQHLATLKECGENVVVLGPMLTPPGHRLAPWVAWEQAMLEKQYASMEQGEWQPTARQFYTGNTTLYRRHLEIIGGFDPAFRRAEDIELAFRLEGLGIQFVFNPRAIGYHYAERSFKSWLSIPYAYGRNDVIFCKDKHHTWLLPTIWREFHTRHSLTRTLAKVCLDRPTASGLAIQGLYWAAMGANALGLNKVSKVAFSGIFNLRYYQGIADQLGGRKDFFEGVEMHARTRSAERLHILQQ